MNQNIAQEILNELFSSLETLDTQTTAILHFLKDKGITTDKDLAPYLEQAGKASNVRWLAARVRIDYLLSSALKAPEHDAKKESSSAKENSQEPAQPESEASVKRETEREKDVQDSQRPVAGKPETREVAAQSEPDREQPAEEANEDVGEDAA